MKYIVTILIVLILGTSSVAYAVAQKNSTKIAKNKSMAEVIVDAPIIVLNETSKEEFQIGIEGTAIVGVAEEPIKIISSAKVFDVPFYSQFDDISATEWKKSACGIASVAMLIEFYKPGETTPDILLKEGIASGAYLNHAGWIHKGLADLADDHGLAGANYDFAHKSMDFAYSQFEAVLKAGPVIASVYYTFTPGHPIPHLVVINGIDGDRVYYNDPSEESGGGYISIDKFKKAWKKRYIEVRSII